MCWLWVLDNTGREWLFIRPEETIMMSLWSISNICYIRRWAIQRLGTNLTEYDMVSAYPK